MKVLLRYFVPILQVRPMQTLFQAVVVFGPAAKPSIAKRTPTPMNNGYNGWQRQRGICHKICNYQKPKIQRNTWHRRLTKPCLYQREHLKDRHQSRAQNRHLYSHPRQPMIWGEEKLRANFLGPFYASSGSVGTPCG